MITLSTRNIQRVRYSLKANIEDVAENFYFKPSMHFVNRHVNKENILYDILELLILFQIKKLQQSQKAARRKLLDHVEVPDFPTRKIFIGENVKKEN